MQADQALAQQDLEEERTRAARLAADKAAAERSASEARAQAEQHRMLAQLGDQRLAVLQREVEVRALAGYMPPAFMGGRLPPRFRATGLPPTHALSWTVTTWFKASCLGFS